MSRDRPGVIAHLTHDVGLEIAIPEPVGSPVHSSGERIGHLRHSIGGRGRRRGTRRSRRRRGHRARVRALAELVGSGVELVGERGL
jgi:hypothetical protein